MAKTLDDVVRSLEDVATEMGSVELENTQLRRVAEEAGSGT